MATSSLRFSFFAERLKVNEREHSQEHASPFDHGGGKLKEGVSTACNGGGRREEEEDDRGWEGSPGVAAVGLEGVRLGPKLHELHGGRRAGRKCDPSYSYLSLLGAELS